MYKYKLTYDELSYQYSILRTSDNTQFLKDSGDNIDYQQFLQDAKTIGIATCVEGPTVGVTTAYNIARQAEYPPIEDQLDKIYHSGVDAWKADIKVIKDKYPKSQVGVTTVAAIPSWVQTEADEGRKTNYLTAVERLKQPVLESSAPTESVWDADQDKYVDVFLAEDPAVKIDEAERVAAQAVIDGTPQSIIDSINT